MAQKTVKAVLRRVGLEKLHGIGCVAVFEVDQRELLACRCFGK